MTSVSVIGLGKMGTPIAWNLLRAGFDLTVWNRSPAKCGELAAAGARQAATPAEALLSDVVVSMLADDRAVEDVILDSGALKAAAAPTVHANLATVSGPLADRAAAAHRAAGVGYVAAPVFGRVPVAEAGNLTIVAAGADDELDRVQPVFDVIGARTFRVGSNPTTANAVKISGNFLLASAIESLGEAIGLAEAFDVEPEQFVEILTTALFPGPVYAGYGRMIATRTYSPAGFTVALGRKDVHLALDAAAAHGVTLPVGDVLRAAFDQSIAEGRSDDDWASLGERLRRRDR